jgi:alpha-beta hydrolase superfamily lysophospholipase
MSTDEKRVREFAYQIWESEGKPEGQEARHWEMARKLAEAEALTPNKPSKTSTAKAAPKATPKATPKAKAKAKPAAAAPVVVPPGEKKAAVKKPRAPRKPPAS